MTNNLREFNFKKNKLIPLDKFIEKILYEPNKGYYTKKVPFGRQGDFITAPTISNLFSESYRCHNHGGDHCHLPTTNS